MQLVQKKMKTISTGTPNFVPTILDSEGKIKDQLEWSSSFESILDHPRFLSFCNNELSTTIVYDMVDIIYKLEAKMSKVASEVKSIIDAKWIKCLEELDTIRNVT